jgi:hypothetical protein
VGKLDHNGTCELPPKNKYKHKYTLRWKLLENSTAKKFSTIMNRLQNKEETIIHWNMYDKTPGDRVEHIAELNREVDRAIELFTTVPMPPELKIQHTDTDPQMLRKLNEIHFVFEKKLTSVTEAGVENFPNDAQDICECCERLNKLVHHIEGLCKSEHSRKHSQTLYVLRYVDYTVSNLSIPDGTCHREFADDDDYKRFDLDVHSGDLYSDFFTVGKDLATCWATDDVELVRRQEIKQQLYISGAVQFTLEKTLFQNYMDQKTKQNIYQDYHKWCHRNKIQNYGYTYWKPLYNAGRIKLATMETDDGFDVIRQKITQFPHICGVKYIH